MKRLFTILLLVLPLVSGCYDNNNDAPSEDIVTNANCTMAQLRQLCPEGCYTVFTDLICAGRVVSSDSEGNFYRSLVIEDNSGGMELKLGTYNIESQYPLGLLVEVTLKGTAVMVEDGVVKVGLPPRSYDSSPREFESQVVIDNYVVRTTSIVEVVPTECDVASLNDMLCGRLIGVDNLTYEPLADDAEPALAEGYYRFVDESDNAIFVYISPYADFANLEMPTSKLHIQGVLYYESVGGGLGKQFVIRPRSQDDISTLYNPS